MLKQYQHTLAQLFLVADTLIVVGAWLASYWFRFSVWPLPALRGLPEFHTYAALAPLVAVLWMAIFTLSHVYDGRRLRGRAEEARQLLGAHGTALLAFVVLTYLVEQYKFSRLVMAYFATLGGAGVVFFHLAVRHVLSLLRANGVSSRALLIVGEGPTLEHLIAKIQRYPELGLSVVGVVTPDESTLAPGYSRPVLGHFSNLCEVIERAHVEEVLVALPPAENQHLDRILDCLKDETIDVRVVLDVHRYVTLGCEIEEFEGLPVVRINDSPHVGWGALAKRVTDIVVSTVALVVLAPLLALIALAVKLSSRGPVLYVQERMGLDGRSFPMLKFRSMRADAEAATGAVWTASCDGRRTGFGTFLRKTSLDELPQLWNVLCGDMSLVGPRPERPVFVDRFRKQIPHYMLRHKVRAGITGWAQVNGWRGNTSLDRRIECDLFYIRNWSYALDLKILTMTLWKGFVHKNAY
ncbi:MAG TPA: undecaprenyl-phosphate glucose phosphotransferase [Polyangiaceae bacterium]|nr:undecaprenyl-phosphate glucose phosphotransferase [Polyangiaceae bacterium]